MVYVAISFNGGGGFFVCGGGWIFCLMLVMGYLFIVMAKSLQKRLLFAMKLFQRLQKAIGKTSFFDGKSLLSTITRRILKYL